MPGGFADLLQTITPHEKIDDEDGHYIVTEDMPIGDRCESPNFHHLIVPGAGNADLHKIDVNGYWARELLAKSSKPGTAGPKPNVQSKSFDQCRSTVMHHGSSYESSRPSPTTTDKTATSVYIYEIASTSVTTFASSPIYSDSLSSTF